MDIMEEENESNPDVWLHTSSETEDGILEEDHRDMGEDNWSSIQEEHDLKAKEKTAQEVNDVCALPAHTATLSVSGASAASNAKTVVEFLCSFLSQMGMTDTLDCFQAEWHEMVVNGQIDPRRIDVMPNVYIQNCHLENELQNAQKEIQEYSQAIAAAEETVIKIQKAKDDHWLRHKRVIQEKNKVIEDIRKLTARCNEYQPKVKQMNEKYQELVQQTKNATRVRDETLVQAKKHSN
ncbi:sperm-associated antigen 16 protein-like [Boleophthalmus pectinirostris]|uniref:sperm-associated antigen 16 protein-like n=1 Tax=Boleophthalmus pectinirostris TaxID=150288 RepID=UPI00242F4963|nr:sperm-associated antigen 16 protein-like [Boleophthalmus pectinirostris]